MSIMQFLQSLLCIFCSYFLFSCQESDLGSFKLSVNAENNYAITTDISTLNLSADRQVKLIAVKANCSWTVECDAYWISVNPRFGHLDGTISISVESNVSEDERQASLMLYTKDDQSRQTVTVVQNGKGQQAGNEDSLGTKTYTINNVTFTMIAVQGGTFQMGATPEQQNPNGDEKPHSVTLSDYCIGETEVTQEQWEAVMGSNPSNFKHINSPVENVSWDDCQTFIKKLNSLTGANFRLPTEAEWEYAARGGDQSRRTQYAGSSDIDKVAWYKGNSNNMTRSVKNKLPNELGLYDMSGNVCEWCQDWYGDYDSSSQTNPKGPSSGTIRIRRGGSWFNDAWSCRSAQRSASNPTFCSHYLGLRLAL